MKHLVYSLNLALFLISLSSCRREIPEPQNGTVKYESPLLGAVAPDYPKSSNDNLAQLGRVLFYDPKLSLDNSISCGSCHIQEKAFADKGRFSEGIDGQISTRNTPCVFPKNGMMFWDGKATSLDELVLMPIENPKEMNIQDFDKLSTKLSGVSYYPELFKRAFNNEQINKDRIRMALKEFVLNFSFSKNKFNSGGLIGSSLSIEESTGKDLFFGKAKCSQCHHLENFGGNGYGSTNESHNIGLDFESADKGCGEFFNDPSRNGEFMNPVLLNIELTSPYMHDGRFTTLNEVIEHYDNKVIASPTLDWRLYDYSEFPNLGSALMNLDKNFNGKIDKDERGNRGAQKLNLSASEKASLIAFLRTLTDLSVLSDIKFKDPFK